MDDIKLACDRLSMFCDISRDVCRTLETALVWIKDAQAELKGLDSSEAAAAYALTVQAHDSICAVVYGWGNDIQNDSMGLKRALEG